jgi:hypothetical protein
MHRLDGTLWSELDPSEVSSILYILVKIDHPELDHVLQPVCHRFTQTYRSCGAQIVQGMYVSAHC